jgi:hypothetical protein
MRRDSLTSHELRDSAGNLIAVLDLIELDRSHGTSAPDHGMVELAADIAGRSIRVRVFPPAAQHNRAAA